MKIKLIMLIVLSFTAFSHASMDGKKLLEEKCSSCHMLTSSTMAKNAKITAPPMWGILRTLEDNFETKEARVNFLIDYSMNPSEKKMVFAKAAKKRFGLMPSMKGELSGDELRAIAEYLYR